MSIPTPESRIEAYLANIAGGSGPLPDPESRIEGYLKLIAENPTGGVWGGITGDLDDQTDLKAALDEKADLVNGLIPASQLPSYVDDVLEYENLEDFPEVGESGKIYIATETNITYRWTGTDYTRMSEGVVLGETESTAYRGDRGKVAYEHSQTPHVTAADLDGKVDKQQAVADAGKVLGIGADGIVQAMSAGGGGGSELTLLWQTGDGYLRDYLVNYQGVIVVLDIFLNNFTNDAYIGLYIQNPSKIQHENPINGRNCFICPLYNSDVLQGFRIGQVAYYGNWEGNRNDFVIGRTVMTIQNGQNPTLEKLSSNWGTITRIYGVK